MDTTEQFDLVDENDAVIGITNKSEAHTRGHIHRVVAVYVFDPAGRLYVQYHEKAKLFDHSVGGHIVSGESYEAGAKRESMEELGISSSLTKLAVFYSDETFTGSNYRHMFGLFETYPDSDWKFIPNEEVKQIVPMTIQQVVEAMNRTPEKFTPGFLNTMEAYISKKQLPYDLDLKKI